MNPHLSAASVPVASPTSETPTLSQAGIRRVRASLAANGLVLDVGAFRVSVRSDVAVLAEHLVAVYPNFAFVVGEPFADLHVEVLLAKGLRRWIHPKVTLSSDGQQHFHPFPADTSLPLLEWGINWLVAEQMQHLLLLHAGALERDGLGLLLPAVPGSGKSTLTAALAHRGWRLLSDEFGAVDPETRRVHAILKPIALKNQSIEVIRRFVPDAVLGPEFPKTRKGTVSHVAAPLEAVRRRNDSAVPALVVLPKWVPGVATSLSRLEPLAVFEALAFNAFNYEVQGLSGFQTVVALARGCEGWKLQYSDLGDALSRLEDLWRDVVDRRSKAGVATEDATAQVDGDRKW